MAISIESPSRKKSVNDLSFLSVGNMKGLRLILVAGAVLLSVVVLVSTLVSLSVASFREIDIASSTINKAADISHLDEYLWNGEEIYLKASKALIPVTDKVTTHTYQVMYGQYLLPYYRKHPNMKLLEIGLGCDMSYGPEASVALYKKLFPMADLWEAEFDAVCVKRGCVNPVCFKDSTLWSVTRGISKCWTNGLRNQVETLM